MPLQERNNLHGRAKSGCEYGIKHFKDICLSVSFSVQAIEVFPGTAYKNNNVVSG